MLDMHCHIVPNVDDGAKDLDTSIQMAKAAKLLGYDGILATSHYIVPDNELVNSEFIKKIDELNKEFKKNKVGVTVYKGNEIFFTNDIVDLIKEKKVCTLADSRYVLIELPLYTNVIPLNVYDEFNKLQDEGYIPILAHPERYDFTTKNINLLYNLIEAGVLLQANISSILGKYGIDAKNNVKKMLKADMIHFLGTDSHGISNYSTYNKAIKKIKKYISDEETFNDIMYGNPLKVLKNQKISIWYPEIEEK